MKRNLVLTLICLLAVLSQSCQVVSSGNYTLRSGEIITGDLTVSGGHANLEQGSRVTGSLVVTGGTVNANGQIDGDVTVTGGTVAMGPGAAVRGDVRRTGGTIRIAEGASVPSRESSDLRTLVHPFGNLATIFILPPFLLIVAVIILLTVRTGRETAPSMTSGSVAGNAASSPVQFTAPAEWGTRLGGSIALGIALIGLGILFLLQELFHVGIWYYAWPLLVVGGGLFCFALMVLNGKNAGRLAIPGSALTILGLLFLYQNTFDLYESWAYAWALIFPTSFGLGRYLEGWWSGRPALREKGIRETRSGLILFVLLAAFFELVLNLSGFFPGGLGTFLFPLLLILVGLILLAKTFLSRLALKPTP